MLVTGNFRDFYGDTMLPALRDVIDRGYRARPPQFSQIFNINPSTRSIEQFSQVSGVGRFSQLSEGGKIRYVSCDKLIGEAIRRIANEESVSKLFD